MARDTTIPLKRAALTALEADADAAAFFASIHPLGEPEWPFARYSGPSAVPLKAACVDGATIEFTVHVFAKPRYDAGAMIETAEDHAGRGGALVAAALDGLALELDADFDARARIVWRSSRLLPDGGEPDAYHSVQVFRARVLS